MFVVYQWEQKQFDGTVKTFEAVKRKNSVQLIVIVDNKLVLLEEEQPFIGKFLALCGGIIESDIFEDDARRELLEETGLVCDDLEFWKKTRFSSKVVWDTYYFIARDCKRISEPELDSGEKIKVLLLSFEEFISEVLSEDFRNKEFANMVLRMYYDDSLDDFKRFIFRS